MTLPALTVYMAEYRPLPISTKGSCVNPNEGNEVTYIVALFVVDLQVRVIVSPIPAIPSPFASEVNATAGFLIALCPGEAVTIKRISRKMLKYP